MLCVMVGGAAILAQPGSAACAILPAMPLDRLADGTLADPGLSATDRKAVVAAHAAALRRIEQMYGPVSSNPVIVQLSSADALWPMRRNSFGSTDFLPGRTCIIVGPDGRNVDVLAHEIVHAEIAHRVGFLRRWLQIPVWFDEGVAMQVDARAAFDTPRNPAAADAVRFKDTAARFFDAAPDELTENYAQVKRVTARWLDRVGRRHLYARLSALRDGATFAEIWAN